MKSFRWIVLLWLGLAAVLGPSGRAAEVDLKLFSLNCYSFPEELTTHLKNATWLLHKTGIGKAVGVSGVTDLQSGIQKSVPQRTGEIAGIITRSQADVAFFQELWNSRNKDRMADALKAGYPYAYANTHIRKGATEVDDGLLIVSRWVPFYTGYMEFRDRYDDESRAHKGALFMGVYLQGGGFALLVNTHMQSGTSDEACAVKLKQIKQLCTRIKRLRAVDWRIQNAAVIIAGDFNEPITFQPDKGRIIDRTRFLVDAYQQNGINVSNDQTVKKLMADFKVSKVVEVYQLQKSGKVRGLDGSTTAMAPDDPVGGRFNGQASGGWAYWPAATEPTGWQVLDHVFLEPLPRCRLKDFQVLRKEVLGDKGPSKPSDPYVMDSDHAAFLATLAISTLK